MNERSRMHHLKKEGNKCLTLLLLFSAKQCCLDLGTHEADTICDALPYFWMGVMDRKEKEKKELIDGHKNKKID